MHIFKASISPFFSLVVLNETERIAKRKMINDNRERRKLEQLRTVLKANSLADKQEEFRTRIDQVTANYCKILDNSLEVKVLTVRCYHNFTLMFSILIVLKLTSLEC